MSRLYRSVFLAALLTAVTAFTVNADDEPLLEFKRLELTDGRTLKDVVVKTYDAEADKLLVLVGRKATTIPLALVPAAVRARFRAEAPPSGSTTNTVREEPKRPAPPAPAVTPGAPTETAPAAPAVDPEGELLALKAAHRQVALHRAELYYRYEFPIGSGYVRVTAQDFDAGLPREVPGWTGRFETAGTVYLEYFDSAGRSFKRVKSTFTVLTEEKPGQGIVVVGFDTKT